MKQNYRTCITSLIAGLLLMGLVPGISVTTVYASEQNPCSEDVAKFCPDVKPGQRALLECLEQHETELSDTCKAYEAQMERPRAESREVVRQQMAIRQACMGDAARFCSDAKPETGGLAACLKSHADELSTPCKKALEGSTGGVSGRTAE